jgi:hypothetical protein
MSFKVLCLKLLFSAGGSHRSPPAGKVKPNDIWLMSPRSIKTDRSPRRLRVWQIHLDGQTTLILSQS